MMSVSDSIVELANRMPQLDELGKVDGPQWEVAEAVITQVFEGGPDRISQVIALLTPPGEGDDCKPRYLLHAMAVHVARPGGDKWRDLYCRVLAAHLESELPKSVRAFLISQLQVAGTPQVTASLGAQLLDKDLCEYAAQALLVIGNGAAHQFRQALQAAEGPVLLTVVHALGVLRDQESAGILRKLVDHENRQIRLAAMDALAGIGDAASVDLLLEKAGKSEGYDRVAATDACLTLAQRLTETGHRDAASRIHTHLRDTRDASSERHVVLAAEKALGKGR